MVVGRTEEGATEEATEEEVTVVGAAERVGEGFPLKGLSSEAIWIGLNKVVERHPRGFHKKSI